jgi:hypothetical protein
MGQPKTPDPVTPGESAQAAMGTAGAGEMMSVANQPIEQYANLQTTRALGPAEMQAQQAVQNQAALQGAMAQKAIQSAVDPMAYAQREMRMQAANKRLGQLYGVDPNAYTYSAATPFLPNAVLTGQPPSIDELRRMGTAAASNLSTGSVNSAGGNPTLNAPVNPQSYLG